MASDDVLALPAGARDELLDPFIEAVSLTLREMASADVAVQAVYDKKRHSTLCDVSGVLALAFPGEGRLVLSFPSATADALARRVLAEVTDAPEPALVCDCVGELTNVVAGQAKALLFGSRYHFTLATPMIITGAGHTIPHLDGAHCLVVAFGSDLGDFALELSVNLGESMGREPR